MIKDAAALFRFIQGRLNDVREAAGMRALTPAQRRIARGEWFATAPDFGDRAAFYCDAHAAHLPDIPYTGSDIRAAFSEALSAEAHVALLEGITQEAKDTMIAKRKRAMAMAKGVLRSLQAVLSGPFLDKDRRRALGAGLKALRHEFDRRNKKISDSMKKRPGETGPAPREVAAQAGPEAEPEDPALKDAAAPALPAPAPAIDEDP